MPTSVPTARQCLTEEAARALDDAVSVAKRRNHSQTTSLHAISALLSPSFSLLRDSLTRVRSSAYSPRLQFRALELSVGVSLDRVPSSKIPNLNDDFTPPVSNSLMAAIKRSQANQRRQPDMYPNPNPNPVAMSPVRVELKYFVLSILDDPIVSRVLGEAGFRSSDIKLNIIHPPLPPAARCPPLFLCNLMDYSIYSGFAAGGGGGGGDENCRRIGEVMVRRKERNNPILIGVCANDGLLRFKDCLEKGRYRDFDFLRDIQVLRMVCLEKEIDAFVGRKKETQGLEIKIKEIGDMLIKNDGLSLVVNLGELKVLVKDDDEDNDNGGGVKDLVMKLKGLVEVYGKNSQKKVLWLIGAATDYETYSKFVGNFPSVEKDWDLHPLPITNSSRSSSFGALGSKSSLMGSFVPFGGLFPTQSDFKTPLISGPSSVPVIDRYSRALPVSDMTKPSTDHVAGQVCNSCSSSESSLNEAACSNSSSGMQILAQSTSISPRKSHSVTTDLVLGTICASKHENFKNPSLQCQLQHFPGSISPIPNTIRETDRGNYKTLFRKLTEVVTWQSEAISRITEIVSGCKNESTNGRRNIWLSFLGPDIVGKKKVSEALADAIFGSKDRLIAVNLSSKPVLFCQESLNFDINSSRITFLDHIAQELCKKPNSVIMLENIDEADPTVQNSLTNAIHTGKFRDSRGREIGINNVVFVVTSSSSVTKDQEKLSPRKEFTKFTEEKLLEEARNWEMQISVRRSESINRVSLKSPKKKLKVANLEANKKPKNSLDLNLPLFEEETEDFHSRAWMEGFLREIDGNVEFKPFDFDTLADKLLTKMRVGFEDNTVSLEVDYEVMVQILAAVWCSEKKDAVEEWVEEVLGSSFGGARERFRLSGECVVRLASCEGVPVKEWYSGICLPTRIHLSI